MSFFIRLKHIHTIKRCLIAETHTYDDYVTLAKKKFPDLRDEILFYDDGGCLLEEDAPYVLSHLMNDPLLQIRQKHENASTASARTETIVESLVDVTSPISERSEMSGGTYDTVRSLEDFDIERILKRTAQGRCVLKCYEMKKILDNSSRRSLVDSVISGAFESKNDSYLSNRELAVLAQKINTLFPNESPEIYYVSPIKKRYSLDGRSGVSRGKLADKYRNCLTKLRDVGILSKRGIKRPINVEMVHVEDDEIAKCREWLKFKTEPWEDVLSNWKSCFTIRKQSKATSSQVFLSEWPILNHPSGYTLIDLDFEILYTGKGILKYDTWETFISKICRTTKHIDNIPEMTDSRNATIIRQIKLLPYLFPPRQRTKKQNGELWKPSTIETLRSIVAEVEIAGDINEEIRRRIDESHQKKITVQPYLLIQGEKTYVIIDTIKYVFEDVLRAFEVLFKCFHVMNINYPCASEHIYFIVQKIIFQVTTEYDTKFIPLIRDVEQKMNVPDYQ